MRQTPRLKVPRYRELAQQVNVTLEDSNPLWAVTMCDIYRFRETDDLDFPNTPAVYHGNVRAMSEPINPPAELHHVGQTWMFRAKERRARAFAVAAETAHRIGDAAIAAKSQLRAVAFGEDDWADLFLARPGSGEWDRRTFGSMRTFQHILDAVNTSLLQDGLPFQLPVGK